MNPIAVIAGDAHPQLAHEIARRAQVPLVPVSLSPGWRHVKPPPSLANFAAFAAGVALMLAVKVALG